MIVEKFNVRLKIWFSGDESNLIDLVFLLVFLFNYYMNNWYFIKFLISIDFIYLFDLI